MTPQVPNCRALPSYVSQMVVGDVIKVMPDAILVGTSGAAYVSGRAEATQCGPVVVSLKADGYHADVSAVDRSYRWERGVYAQQQPFRLRSLTGAIC